MGYMTTVTFLNDDWSRIKSNPQEFIDRIEDGMNGIEYGKYTNKIITTHGIANSCNGVKVAQSHHADIYQLYLVGRNSMTVLGHHNNNESLDWRKENLKIARQLIKLENTNINELEKEIKN